MTALLNDFLELLGADADDSVALPWEAAEHRFCEPWLAWSVAWDRLRQLRARFERSTASELERFLARSRQDAGPYRAELELDSQGEGARLLRYAEGVLEELRARQTPAEAEA